jgi:hypothetical protein
MPSLEERFASLEAKVSRMDDLPSLMAAFRADTSRQLTDLREDMNRQFGLVHEQIRELRSDMIRRFEQVDRRFEQVDRRFEQVDRRFEQVDRRFEQVDRRFEQVEQRFQVFDLKVDRHFTWVVGIQVALMLAVIGAMAGAYYR